MTKRMLLTVLCALAPGGAQCLPVSGRQISAGDMARAVPVFSAVAPELVLGDAPALGGRRTYGAAELGRLARRFGLPMDPGLEACFVRPLETLSRERIATVLGTVMPAARIQVVDFGRQPVPPGELRFSLSGLETGPAKSAPLLWRGAVCLPGQSDFPVWAKVRVQVSGKRAIAAEALAPGLRIVPAQLREEVYEGPPGFPDLSQVVGREPRRPIAAGSAIESLWIEEPPEVQRGERVQVEIRSGRTRILLEGQAQSSGRRGQTVEVRNPGNGRILRAIVTDRGRVVVTAPGGEAAPLEGGLR